MQIRVCVLVAVAGSVAIAHADVVTSWNQAMLDAIAAENMAPPRAARAMAMMHTAQYEAVNSVAQTHTPFASYLPCPTGTSAEAAAVQAAHDVLSNLFPTRTTTFDVLRASHLAGIADGASKVDGLALGANAATFMLASRSNDNSGISIIDNGSTVIGEWRPTGPAFLPAALPQWRYVTPFAVPSAQTFLAPAPPQLTSAQYTAAYNEVKSLGSSTSAVRTQQQTDTAFLWRAGANTVTPPGMWNQIAQQASASHALTLEDNARLFATLGIAEADAAVTAWEAKNLYDVWRPETGIQLGDLDFNPQTAGDASWQPLFVTPNHQSYVSGHSTFSSAAAAVLASFFGTDAMNFTVTGDGITRPYSSFSGAAQEAGMSRIYGGIHWQFDNQAGLASGTALGNYVASTMFTPVPAPGAWVAGAAFVWAGGRRRRAR